VFDNRHVDVDRARTTCGSPIYFEKGIATQSKSLVLLSDEAGMLSDRTLVYVEGIQDAPDLATTTDLADAEAIIVRLEAPFDIGRGSVVAEYFHGGTLAFSQGTLDRLRDYAARAPLYVSIFLERPAILGPIIELGATVLGEFGASDRVIISALTGRTPLTGTLHFDIPSSMEAVENSREDVPFDTEAPLFRAGFGIVREAGAPSAAVPA
jgi:beta-glucosidase